MSQEKLAAVVQRCSKDPAFQRRLVADPKGVLAEEGILVSGEIDLKILVDTPKVLHLVLPVEPSGELSEAELAQVAGGLAASAYQLGAFDWRRFRHMIQIPLKTTEPPH